MTVRVGVIGAGQIAKRRHIPEYDAHPNVTIRALCDIDEGKAATLATEYGIKKVCTDYQQILDDGDIDAVSICTPNYLHAPITIAAANAGKHILVEKPMATTLEEADAMVQAAKENEVMLMVGQNQRLAPIHQVAKRVLQSGMLGRVTSFRTTFGHPGPEYWSPTGKWFFSKKEAWAGAMADLGVHKADLMRWLIGDEVQEVAAFISCFEKPGDVDDNAICILRFKKGIIGTLTASWTYKPKEDNSTIIYCEKGTLKLAADPDNPILVEFAQPGKGEATFEVPKLQSNEAGGQSSSGVIDAFIDCLESGHAPTINGEEGRRALEIIIAAFQSADDSRVVQLPL